MSHEILKRFRIHPGLRHVGTVGMAAYMRCNFGHLKLVDGIILVHYVLKVMIPVKRVCNASILVVVQKSGIPVNYRLNLGCVAFRNDLPKASLNVFCHRQYSGSASSLCALDVVSNMCTLLKLMVHIDLVILKIDIPKSQSAKLRDAKSRMEKNIDSFIVFAKMRILFYKLKEFSLFVPGYRKPCMASFTITDANSKSNGLLRIRSSSTAILKAGLKTPLKE